ncbi:rhodanese-like domain-containing protein [Reichenbachiella sp. MALMAid0571]|uniref:rhodanese-like domain-containing protein n=1 Tax=Reichenbachiella sp. MALMAid0571 TaxID=3143939 RepID=UPI0032DF9B99
MSKKEKAYDLMLQNMLSHTVEEIKVEEADTIQDIIWLDAREKKEYDVSKIKNAVWVGYDDFDLKRVTNIEKDQKLIVYCSIGYRSEKVVEKLKSAGYKNVKNLYGGIFSWVNKDNN